ncbi:MULTISPECIES: hypothetical protein [Paraburkholderia]|uniref:hypothetical protein n=1 Tax=Paraburkholderia TaxID=1822464 RepID=UPI003218D625
MGFFFVDIAIEPGRSAECSTFHHAATMVRIPTNGCGTMVSFDESFLLDALLMLAVIATASAAHRH